MRTAESVKLYLLPSPQGWYNFAGMNPAADGVTDDWPKLQKLLALRLPNSNSTFPKGPTIFFPAGRYKFNVNQHGIQLKAGTHLIGENGGMSNAFTGTEFVFPPDCAGIVINYIDTLNGGVEDVATGGADGSSITNIALTGVRGTNPTAHGLWLRTRATIRNVLIRNFTGNGVHIVAGLGGDGAIRGNANTWMLDTIRVISCGGNGFFVDGADANAGVGIACDGTSNGRWGIWDSSFLGNTWIGCHTASNGVAHVASNGANKTSFIHYDGLRYGPHPNATEADLVATQPGTNALIWVPLAVGGAHPQIPTWLPDQPEGTYFQGGSYKSDNRNATNVFLGCYAEGDQSGNAFVGPTLALGGSIFTCGFTAGGYIRSTEGNRLEALGAVAGYIVRGGHLLTTLGGSDVNGDVLKFESLADTGANRTWRFHRRGADWDLDNANLASRLAMRLTGENTSEQMGTGAPVPYQAVFPTLAIGSSTNIRRQETGTAAATTGAWAKGDIRWNSNVSAGSNIGWICTVAGTPGTWIPIGQAGPVTSVVSVPSHLGQFAVVGDVAYIAVGTSSADDWKQIT
ncbi:glycosyl hydrolase family 28-related protein [Pseudorhodoplanes sp.]|uniref:glycosyl hydrolase family 28-related protein n=1 Tax=Pseudorhodoplanes sp. TaxID=1934341 RepID=UPI003D0A97E3